MYLVNKQQMKKIDQTAINEWHIPEMILMENAGIAIVHVLQEKIADLQQQNVTVLIGSGNNGGDGLVIARQLYQLGVPVKVFLLAEKGLTGSAAANLAILECYPIKVYTVDNENSLHLLKATLNYTDVVIDAILGLGINRPVSAAVDKVLTIINKRSCLKIAVDIPSGLDADSGQVWGNCLVADYTITLGLPKQGQFLNQGPRVCGELITKDISIPTEIMQNSKLWCQTLDQDYLAQHLMTRQPDSHKGTYGHLAILGGSQGMSGAVTLATRGSLRSGVGKVTCVVPQAIHVPITINTPEAMVYPLADEGQGIWSGQRLEQALPMLADKQAIVLGPGLGDGEKLSQGLEAILAKVSCPVVIDADGLKAIALELSVLTQGEGPVILTPHPGEMSALIGLPTSHVQANRLSVAKDFAQKYQVWLVLKGEKTIIATPEGNCFINTMDSPALAVAGSGDVLSGIIGAFLAQGLTPEEACCCAVNLHGRAGLWIEQQIGAISSTAGDIVDAIPAIIRGV